jgi:hypothetical protein
LGAIRHCGFRPGFRNIPQTAAQYVTAQDDDHNRKAWECHDPAQGIRASWTLLEQSLKKFIDNFTRRGREQRAVQKPKRTF